MGLVSALRSFLATGRHNNSTVIQLFVLIMLSTWRDVLVWYKAEVGGSKKRGSL